MKANELSCKELMVGDWVKPQNVDVSFRVGLIGVDSVWNDTDTHEWNYDELEPIPLTPEILEKNGFVVESRYCHGEPLQYCKLVNGLWIDISGENFFEGKLEYVHQFQHALRLCGIEKTIEL